MIAMALLCGVILGLRMALGHVYLIPGAPLIGIRAMKHAIVIRVGGLHHAKQARVQDWRAGEEGQDL